MDQNNNTFHLAKVMLKNGKIRFGIILSEIAELEAGKDILFINNSVEPITADYLVRDIETISNAHVMGIDLMLK